MSIPEKEQENFVFDIASANNFDMRPYSVALELKRLMAGMVDAGTSIDSGTGATEADLDAKIGGVEYHITIKVGRELTP